MAARYLSNMENEVNPARLLMATMDNSGYDEVTLGR